MSSKWFQFNHVCNWFNYDFVFALFALYCLTSNLFCFFWFTFSIIFQCIGAGLMQKSLQRFCVCVFNDFSKIGFTCLTLWNIRGHIQIHYAGGWFCSLYRLLSVYTSNFCPFSWLSFSPHYLQMDSSKKVF